MTPEEKNAVRLTAYRLREIGIPPIPVGQSKRPIGKWKQFQTIIPDDRDMAAAFPERGPRMPDGVGIVTGNVGGVEMFEFEGRAKHLYKQLQQRLDDNGLGHIWTKIHGYVEETPSGGIHFYYRVNGPVKPSEKLARRLATRDELIENPNDPIKVLIETRGEGGYSVVAPSGGICIDSRYGPDAKPWHILFGSLDTIPTLTTEEYEALWELARTFDELPPEPEQEPREYVRAEPRPLDEERPGDHFIRHMDTERFLQELLLPDGWTVESRFRKGYMLTRPGKERKDGASASLGLHDVARLYVFSTSAGLPTNQPIDALKYLAITRYNGDISAAASDLRKQGFGAPLKERSFGAGIFGDPGPDLPEQPTPEEPADLPPADPEPQDKPKPAAKPKPKPDKTTTDGTLATVTELDKKRQSKPVRATGLFATDTGNAKHLVDAHGDRIRWCPERKEWALFTGKRWEWQGIDGGQIQRLMIEVVGTYDDDDDNVWKWKKKSLDANRIAAAVKVARTDPRILAPAATFDAQPYELNTPNGTVNLRTGELMPHDPTKLHTRMTALEYHPDADPTAVNKFFQETFEGPNRDETIGYLQRLVGHSLLGEVREHILPYLLGNRGRNGKSVFVHSTRRALGDYADSLTNGFFMKQTKIREDELAGLHGIRYGVCSEVNQEDVFDEARTKTYVGGDAIKARFLFGKYFTYRPTHHFWLMGNYRPAVKAGGPAFWARLKLIEFPNSRPEHLQDKNLENRLANDPALLTWMIYGTLDYLERGLQEPAHITAATTEYAHDEDTLAQFLEDRYYTSPALANTGAYVPTADLLAAYKDWGRANGHRIDVTQAMLSRNMKTQFGIENKVQRHNGKPTRVYVGVAPLTEEEDPESGVTERLDLA